MDSDLGGKLELDKLGFDGGLTCAVECSDLDQALEWYRKTLGFELIFRVDDIGWAEMRTPVARVNLGLSQVETPQTRGGTTLTFGVRDVDVAREELETMGVAFDGETMVYDGMVKLATFFDADGNTLMLYEDLANQKHS